MFICLSPAVGKQIVKVAAFDKDSGSNGEITYSLAQPVHDSSNNMFDVNQQTGDVKLKAKLDREDIEQHILYIKAEDKGSPKNAGTCLIRLHHYCTPLCLITFFILFSSVISFNDN